MKMKAYTKIKLRAWRPYPERGRPKLINAESDSRLFHWNQIFNELAEAGPVYSTSNTKLQLTLPIEPETLFTRSQA